MEFKEIVELAKKRGLETGKAKHSDIMAAFQSDKIYSRMDHTRSDQRIKYISKCQLEIQGISYSGLLENVSTSGASIDVVDAVPDSIRCGDPCNLTTLLLGPVKLPCKIIRIDSTRIGLQFI